MQWFGKTKLTKQLNIKLEFVFIFVDGKQESEGRAR